MNTLIATYRVVTPMFLGGADPKSPPKEIRTPSIKGALRFWWRAAAWRRGVESIQQLRRDESELFGSTGTGQSRVRLQVRIQGEVRPGNAASAWGAGSWQNYTGYGLKDASRFAIGHGTVFDLHCLCRKETTTDQQNQIIEAVKLLGLIGGLGSRSRNGWGSVTLASISGAMSWTAPRDADSLRGEIKTVLGIGRSPNRPSFTAISDLADFEVGHGFQSPDKAQEKLGSAYRAHVQNVPKNDYRWQFGIPRKSSKHPSLNNADRRAKPLFLHVHQPDESAPAIPLALYLPAQFMPTQAEFPNNGRDAKVFLSAVKHLRR
jgi:CRISPR-associated protein Cmr1